MIMGIELPSQVYEKIEKAKAELSRRWRQFHRAYETLNRTYSSLVSRLKRQRKEALKKIETTAKEEEEKQKKEYEKRKTEAILEKRKLPFYRTLQIAMGGKLKADIYRKKVYQYLDKIKKQLEENLRKIQEWKMQQTKKVEEAFKKEMARIQSWYNKQLRKLRRAERSLASVRIPSPEELKKKIEEKAETYNQKLQEAVLSGSPAKVREVLREMSKEGLNVSGDLAISLQRQAVINSYIEDYQKAMNEGNYDAASKYLQVIKSLAGINNDEELKKMAEESLKNLEKMIKNKMSYLPGTYQPPTSSNIFLQALTGQNIELPVYPEFSFKEERIPKNIEFFTERLPEEWEWSPTAEVTKSLEEKAMKEKGVISQFLRGVQLMIVPGFVGTIELGQRAIDWLRTEISLRTKGTIPVERPYYKEVQPLPGGTYFPTKWETLKGGIPLSSRPTIRMIKGGMKISGELLPSERVGTTPLQITPEGLVGIEKGNIVEVPASIYPELVKRHYEIGKEMLIQTVESLSPITIGNYIAEWIARKPAVGLGMLATVISPAIEQAFKDIVRVGRKISLRNRFLKLAELMEKGEAPPTFLKLYDPIADKEYWIRLTPEELRELAPVVGKEKLWWNKVQEILQRRYLDFHKRMSDYFLDVAGLEMRKKPRAPAVRLPYEYRIKNVNYLLAEGTAKELREIYPHLPASERVFFGGPLEYYGKLKNKKIFLTFSRRGLSAIGHDLITMSDMVGIHIPVEVNEAIRILGLDEVMKRIPLKNLKGKVMYHIIRSDEPKYVEMIVSKEGKFKWSSKGMPPLGVGRKTQTIQAFSVGFGRDTLVWGYSIVGEEPRPFFGLSKKIRPRLTAEVIMIPERDKVKLILGMTKYNVRGKYRGVGVGAKIEIPLEDLFEKYYGEALEGLPADYDKVKPKLKKYIDSLIEEFERKNKVKFTKRTRTKIERMIEFILSEKAKGQITTILEKTKGKVLTQTKPQVVQALLDKVVDEGIKLKKKIPPSMKTRGLEPIMNKLRDYLAPEMKRFEDVINALSPLSRFRYRYREIYKQKQRYGLLQRLAEKPSLLELERVHPSTVKKVKPKQLEDLFEKIAPRFSLLEKVVTLQKIQEGQLPPLDALSLPFFASFGIPTPKRYPRTKKKAIGEAVVKRKKQKSKKKKRRIKARLKTKFLKKK